MKVTEILFIQKEKHTQPRPKFSSSTESKIRLRLNTQKIIIFFFYIFFLKNLFMQCMHFGWWGLFRSQVIDV